MASPQKENGFTGISNEIMEALCRARLTGQELSITLYIIRCTYGYGRKEVNLSLSEIAKATNMKRQHAHRVLANLSPKRVIAVTKYGDRRKQTFKFNKNYDEWKEKPKKSSVTTYGDSSVTTYGDRKDDLPIIEIKKEIYAKNASFSRWKYEKKMPLPKDFELTQDMVDYAQSKNYSADLNEFTENFILTCQAQSKKYANWYSAWQKWLMNDIKWHPERTKNPIRPQPKKFEHRYEDE